MDLHAHLVNHTAHSAAPVASIPVAAEVLASSARSTGPASQLAARRLWQRRVLVGLLVMMDLSVFVLALRLAQWSYQLPWLRAVGGGIPPRLAPNLLLWGVIALPTLIARGQYRFTYRDGLYSIGRCATSVALAGALYAVVLYISERPISRTFALLVVLCTLVLLSSSRMLFRALASRLPPLSRRVIVVGHGANAKSAARMVAQYWRQGLHLVRVRNTTGADGSAHDQSAIDDAALDTNDLQAITAHIRAFDIDDVVITREWYAQNCPDLEHVYLLLTRIPAHVHVASNPMELLTRLSVDDFSGLPVIRISGLSPSAWQLALKRIGDLVVATALLVLLSPLLLVIGAVIRRDSPGPAIFKQLRVGQHHRLFTIYKFRTMYDESASRPQPGGVHKRKGDPRVTRVGRFLRRTSLDELPQLLNVLKGDMSLVGPRPELPQIVAGYQPWQYGRLLMPPGITGWWQINGRGERILHEHIEDDIYYVRNFSLLLDAEILLMTVRAMISGRGAF